MLSSSGLPKNLKASIVLHGKTANRGLRFSGTRALSLAPGSYSVLVKSVTVRKAGHGLKRGAVAYPEKKRIRVTVKDGTASKLEVRYRAVVNPGVKPLPAGVLRVIGDPEDPSAIVLLANTKAPPVGTIYTTAPSSLLPRGLISKVTSTKKTGNRIRVSLKAVPVTDAVPNLEFNGKLALEPVAGSSADRVALAARGRKQATASKSSCSPPKMLKFGAHLNSFELRQASIGAWPPQMRLTLAIRTTESLGVTAAAAGINCNWTLAELGPYQAAIPVGPVVIPVYATVPLSAGAHINGRFDVGTVNIASTTVATTAAGFDESKASLSQQGTNVWTSGALSLSGSAKLDASVGVEAGIGVAKGANVHVAAGFGPEFDWDSGHSCDLFLNLGSLSAGVTVFGKNLNTPAFTPLRPRLWTGCGGGGSTGSGGGGASGSGGGGGGGEGGGDDSGPLPPVAASRLDAGGTHSCFVSSGGRVFCWGSNQYGELGNGTKVDSATSIEVPGVTGAVSVSSGGTFSGALADTGETCALLVGGKVSCWGFSQAPHVISGLPPASDVSASSLDTCALVGGGHVDCWSSPVAPIEQVDGIEGATAIASADDFGCALIASGEVRCWGSNYAGQLGNGTTQASTTPVAVHGITTAKAIDASGGSSSHACAALADGTVECWGWDGQEVREIPQPVEGVDGAVDVSVGDGHACVLLSSGAIDCWGYDRYGQLGFESPRGYLPLFNSAHGVQGITQARAISAGGQHSCALVPDGVECWGNNAAGQLGRPTGRYAFTPVKVSGLQDVVAISTGADSYESRGHSCALRSGGAVDCWGSNDAGQLGDGSFNYSTVPVSTGISNAKAIGVGEMDSCAVLAAGAVTCWGAFMSADHPFGSETPIPIQGVEGAIAVATSSNTFAGGHSCALLNDGKVMCWGENERGELGVGDTNEHSAPELVSGIERATEIAAGGSQTCALLEGGTIKCWGGNEFGQLGDGTRENRASAVTVAGISDAVQVSAEGADTCAVLANGAVECWGSGFEGQFGPPFVEAQTVPVAIPGLEHARSITAAPNEMCAGLASGSVTCLRNGAWWDVGPFHTSGGNTAGARLDLSSLTGVVAVSAGNGHACVLESSGDVACWGANNEGELGNGTLGYSPTPEPVQGLPE